LKKYVYVAIIERMVAIRRSVQFLQRYVVLREIGGYERDKDKEDIQ
jgi:hypothetical protein